jgi:hypothetical protein
MAKGAERPVSRPTRPARRREAPDQLPRQNERSPRRRRLTIAGLVVGGVLVVIVGIVVSGLRWANGSGEKTVPAEPALVRTLTTIPASTFDQVGAGKVDTLPTQITGQPALTEDGKPHVLYVGAEYCPFCAAERWAVVAALSRFGTFSHLGQTTSARADVYPETATLSFHGSRYHSRYLAFTGYELWSNQVQGTSYAPLDTMSTDDSAVYNKYDGPPYLSSRNSIPFLDLGGRYVSQGASYSPGLLGGLDHVQIAQAIADPSTDISHAVLGTANTITAALCQQTHDQPADVCHSSGVTAAADTLGSAS